MAERVIGDGHVRTQVIDEILSNDNNEAWLIMDNRWMSLGGRLQVPPACIESLMRNLALNLINIQMIMDRILVEWYGLRGNEATIRALIKALVQNEAVAIADALKTKYGYTTNITKHTTWNELSEGFRSDVLSKSVDFQGRSILFKDLFCLYNLDPGDVLGAAEIGGTLTELLNDKQITIIQPSVPFTVSYYIPRQMKQTNVINTKALEHNCNDIFLIKSIGWSDLCRLVNGKETDRSSEVVKLTTRFILLDHNEDVEEICGLTENPVHVLEYKEGKLFWEWTRGSVANLLPFIEENEDKMDEGRFLEECQKKKSPVCISDTPGMGKSFLLANLGRRLMKMYPERLVRFTVMREFVEEVNKNNVEVNAELICKLIAGKCSSHEVGKKLAYEMLRSKDIQCELLFDGLDEVISSQMQLAKEILKVLTRELENCRVYVMSRPHLKHELENLVCTLGWNMVPFDDKEQCNFLVQYWMEHGASCEDKLEEYAGVCLNSIKSKMTDFERDIAGIPLQSKLLAEIHCAGAKKFSSGPISILDYGNSIKISSVFQMYQKLMEMRFENYQHTKRRLMQLSLQVVFPDRASKFDDVLGNEKVSPEDIYRVGLVEKTEPEDFRFVHRTFAEYLVAWFVAEILEMESGQQGEIFGAFIFGEILRTSGKNECPVSRIVWKSLKPIQSADFIFPVVCYFLNEFITPLKAHVSVTNLHERQGDLAKSFTAAVVSDYRNIVEFLLTWQDVFIDNVVPDELSLLAAKYSSVGVMEMVYKLLLHGGIELTSIDYPLYEDTLMLTPLHVAAYHGRFKVFVWLLNTGGFARLLKDNSDKTKLLLNFFLINSAGDPENVLSHKLEMVNLLFKEYSWTLEEKYLDGPTPLLGYRVHFKVIKRLITLGADVNAVDGRGECVLHKAAFICESTQYSEFVEFLRRTEFQHYDLADVNGYTPLMRAVARVDVTKETLKVLVDRGANVNAADLMNISVLFHAVLSGRNAQFVDCLLEAGANVKHTNNAGQNVLHWAAIGGNLGAVKVILDKYPEITRQLVNEVDEDLRTPLHYALYKNTSEHGKIAEVLIEAGADLKAKEKHGDIPIVYALKCRMGVGVEVMRLMEEWGLDFREIADECLTHFCANRHIDVGEFVEVAEFLMERGGVLRCQNGGNLWDSEYLTKEFEKVVGCTKLNTGFLTEVANRRMWPQTSKPDSPAEFYNGICKIPGSYERVMICLIISGQIRAFGIMKQVVRMETYGLWFCTPVPGLKELLEDDKTVVILTGNVDGCVVRLEDTLKEDFMVVDCKDLGLDESTEKFIVVKMDGDLNDPVLNKVEEMGGKFVIVCRKRRRYSMVQERWEDIRIIEDDWGFQDLTEFAKDQVIRKLRAELPGEIYKCVEGRLEVLGAELLCNTVDMRSVGAVGTALSKSIFGVYHCDLIVVMGIGVEELKKYCELGQVVVEEHGFNEEELVDYVVVDSHENWFEEDWDFREITERRGVHFVKYVNGNFRLVDSHRSGDWREWFAKGSGDWREWFAKGSEDGEEVMFSSKCELGRRGLVLDYMQIGQG